MKKKLIQNYSFHAARTYKIKKGKKLTRYYNKDYKTKQKIIAIFNISATSFSDLGNNFFGNLFNFNMIF